MGILFAGHAISGFTDIRGLGTERLAKQGLAFVLPILMCFAHV